MASVRQSPEPAPTSQGRAGASYASSRELSPATREPGGSSRRCAPALAQSSVPTTRPLTLTVTRCAAGPPFQRNGNPSNISVRAPASSAGSVKVEAPPSDQRNARPSASRSALAWKPLVHGCGASGVAGASSRRRASGVAAASQSTIQAFARSPGAEGASPRRAQPACIWTQATAHAAPSRTRRAFAGCKRAPAIAQAAPPGSRPTTPSGPSAPSRAPGMPRSVIARGSSRRSSSSSASPLCSRATSRTVRPCSNAC